MYSSVDTIWVLLGAVLVFFMQAGFTMLEAGFTRAKNAGNIIMKNIMDFAIGTLAFWIIGFGLMHNSTNGGIIGNLDIFVRGDYSSTYPTYAYLIFQTVFCATSATIVSGAMAERTKFSAYLIYSLVISALIYPISGHWVWNSSGWLAKLGFHDFAGSTAVHLVGGTSALIGAKMLGPRIGKYTKSGKSKAIPGHNLIFSALGIFILWLSWFGFNGCSTLSVTGDETLKTIGSIFVATNISAATCTVTTMFITWARYGKPDVSMTLNGALAGLVAITAGCDMVSPIGAFFIGLITAFALVFGIEFIDHKLKIDDPVGAIGVHGICGMLGTLLTGVFSTTKGILYAGTFNFFGVQLLGVISVAAWVAVTMTIVFAIIKKTVGLRVTPEEENKGLDISEHGIPGAYTDSIPNGTYLRDSGEHLEAVFDASASPIVELTPELTAVDGKIRKVVVLMNQNRFEALKAALDKLDITGMTVTNVLGCGIQKGYTEYYRGSTFESHLLPKIKVEIVISTVPLKLLVETIKKVLYTGNIGDGKIFVYSVENVIKVRTGAEGKAALE